MIAFSGLVNIEYLKVIGQGVEPITCAPSYTLSVEQNREEAGKVSHEPVMDYYDEGTLVTVTAQPEPGYFFKAGWVMCPERMLCTRFL